MIPIRDQGLIYFFIFLLAVSFIFVACSWDEKSNYLDAEVQESIITDTAALSLKSSPSLSDTVIQFVRVGYDVNVYYFNYTAENAAAAKGTIVVLPGWNYPVIDWCNKTTLCEKALGMGFNLLMVDMQKSIYYKTTLPQTRKDLVQFATRDWFMDTLMPYFQDNYEVLLKGSKNYILGLSTGGSGAALLCLDRPEVFTKGASLSGDYNQATISDDNLLKLFFGSYSYSPQNWIGENNVVYNIDRFDVPFYIGHGLLDPVCKPEQSIEFYDSLKIHKPALEIVLHIDSTAKHDYYYWDSEVDNVLRFFCFDNQKNNH